MIVVNRHDRTIKLQTPEQSGFWGFCAGAGKQFASLLLAGLLAVGLLPAAARADDNSVDLSAYHGNASGFTNMRVSKAYVLGINRFDLDEHTEILGWQLADSWYLGRQDGLDSGLTLVWQQDANQFSLSKDGLRLTRRF